MSRENSDVRLDFIGDVVRHTKGGVVHCDAAPGTGQVDFQHECREQMVAGEGIILWYRKNEGEEDWFQMLRFCTNCDDARTLPREGRNHGQDQAVIEGKLQHFEGTVNRDFYDDAVRLVDVEVHHYSPPSEGN